jgi:branched-chain amino acid aminotransferase
MRAKVSVDGRVVDPGDARISVFDRGFLYGDSVYEVLWWHRGTPIQEREHLARLRESARRIYLDLGGPVERFSGSVAATVRAAEVTPDEDAYVRLVVTRGAGPLGLRFGPGLAPTVVVIVAPAERPDAAAFERGLSVALVDRLRVSRRALDPAAKTGNYMNNVLALHEANAAGADDAVMTNDRGEVAEGSTSNVYLVARGVLATPPLDAGILEGTTRTRILALARREGLPVEERALRPDDLRAADEAFLSSSVRGILPVTRVDGRTLGDGRPGPVTRRVHDLFERAADAEAAARRARPPT